MTEDIRAGDKRAGGKGGGKRVGCEAEGNLPPRGSRGPPGNKGKGLGIPRGRW